MVLWRAHAAQVRAGLSWLFVSGADEPVAELRLLHESESMPCGGAGRKARRTLVPRLSQRQTEVRLADAQFPSEGIHHVHQSHRLARVGSMSNPTRMV